MTHDHEPIARILFPSDLNDQGDLAFRTALRFALIFRAGLTILHVGEEDREHVDWSKFPAVRDVLVQWGLLPAGSAVDDIAARLGISVRKHVLHSDDVNRSIARFIDRHPYDMLVLPTAARTGMDRLLEPSVAERVAEFAGLPALFLPDGANSLLRPLDGGLSIRRVLVPVRDRSCWDAVSPYIRSLTPASIDRPVDVTLLHIGLAPAWWDHLDVAGTTDAVIHRSVLQGETAPTLIQAALSIGCDLIIMATNGHDGLRDRLYGSTTEQMVRECRTPLLAIPVS